MLGYTLSYGQSFVVPSGSHYNKLVLHVCHLPNDVTEKEVTILFG